MKIIAAPNSFKGSLDGFQAAEAMRRGIHRISRAIEVVCLPVADGGDGMADILTRSLQGRMIPAVVSGPLRQDIDSSFGYISRQATGIVEMARAAGLTLIPRDRRNPLLTTTFGVGQLILRCLDLNVQRLIVGLGGSGTCDGGIGAASALGYRFLDPQGQELEPVGKNLIRIHSIDSKSVDDRLFGTSIEAVCDVVNPLTGPQGASHVYSPQKGASEEEVGMLDEGLANLAEVIRKDLGTDVEMLPGSGAAGGLGAGIRAFMGGELKKGIDLILEILELPQKIRGADLVITGEGKIDFQTKFDKAPVGVARAAREKGIPCIAVCGAIGAGIEELHAEGIDAVFSLCNEPMELEQAMSGSAGLLEKSVEQAVRLFLSAGRQSLQES